MRSEKVMVLEGGVRRPGLKWSIVQSPNSKWIR